VARLNVGAGFIPTRKAAALWVCNRRRSTIPQDARVLRRFLYPRPLSGCAVCVTFAVTRFDTIHGFQDSFELPDPTGIPAPAADVRPRDHGAVYAHERFASSSQGEKHSQ
jgi:hypothetical protein